jgi:hypothetical protein
MGFCILLIAFLSLGGLNKEKALPFHGKAFSLVAEEGLFE